jgi:hypothetical protein
MDKYGNKYFENLEEELPRKLDTYSFSVRGADNVAVRTRWVDYKDHEFDPYANFRHFILDIC